MSQFLFITVLLFAVLQGCQSLPQEADTLTVPLTASDTDSPFGNAAALVRPVDTTRTTFWAKMMQPTTGMPDTLLEANLYAENLQIRQLVYHGYSSGQMDSAYYASWIEGLEYDTTKYTAAFVDQQIHFVYGKTKTNQHVAIFDTDNDEDFTDEEAIMYPQKAPDLRVEKLPLVGVEFDLFDGTQVITTTAEIQLNPYLIHPPGMTGVVFSGRSFRTGRLEYKNQAYAWWVADTGSPGIFMPSDVRMWFEPISAGDKTVPQRPRVQEELREKALQDSTGDEIPEGFYPLLSETYRYGDIVMLGEEAFKLADIDLLGHSLTLERTEKTNIGLRTGMIAPDFEATALDSSVVRLSAYRGSYVLIDFWGTWCAPCITELPYLRASYETYSREEFNIIAIAHDVEDAVRTFISKEGLPWTQVIQSANGLAPTPILDSYHVTGYPTTFLIDPEGVIVAREGDLRGERLAKTLAEHL